MYVGIFLFFILGYLAYLLIFIALTYVKIYFMSVHTLFSSFFLKKYSVHFEAPMYSKVF